MLQRSLSTLALWLLVFGVLYFFRTEGALALIAIMAFGTLREFYKLLAGAGFAPFDRLGTTFGLIIVIGPYLTARWGLPLTHVLPVAVIVFSIRILGERQPENRVESLAATLFGLAYVALSLSYHTRVVLAWPESPAVGLVLFLWLVAVAKFCDVGALLGGMAFGRHKMSPQISPKKTWEGALGGILTSMGVGALIAWLARDLLLPEVPRMTPVIGALLAAPIAALAIVSDLVESIIKRRSALKDSGRTVPGIGGMFDLSDSLILTAPLGYLLFGLL